MQWLKEVRPTLAPPGARQETKPFEGPHDGNPSTQITIAKDDHNKSKATIGPKLMTKDTLDRFIPGRPRLGKTKVTPMASSMVQMALQPYW